LINTDVTTTLQRKRTTHEHLEKDQQVLEVQLEKDGDSSTRQRWMKTACGLLQTEIDEDSLWPVICCG